ncbi:conjugal transfer protein TrbE [Microbulbifer aggregans]|uniref:VirB4 family type IV secretion/conjugal transfer ATPase n=1 Tax=Microbulbifer aggregans TaxID=1769779 RepID=UPI001CFEDA83|nr:conjugal transfer protein TrbE [Microbulbifer aggregans]
MLNIKAYQGREPGFSDLLNYAAVVDDGVVSLKDGSFMAGFFYRGEDTFSTTGSELDWQAAQINRAGSNLGSGWMIHCDAVRMPAPKYDLMKRSFFPDPVTLAIEQERQKYFSAEGNAYLSEYALIVTYQPPLRIQSRMVDVMYEGGTKNRVSDEERGTQILEEFKERVAKLERDLSSVLTMRRMRGQPYIDEYGCEHIHDELLAYINFCICGKRHPVNLPPIPMYLDSVLGARDFFTGVTPNIDGKYICPVAIEGYPPESYPAMLSVMDQIHTEYRWSTRFIFEDPEAAKSALNKFKKKWEQKKRGLWDQVTKNEKGHINEEAVRMERQAQQAINDVESGVVCYGYITSVLLLYGKNQDLLLEEAQEIQAKIERLGFNVRIETINATEAYLGSLPGHSRENVVRPMVNTLNLAHLLPTSAIWAGEKNCPCPFYPPESPPLMHCATHGATPFRLNLHVDDLGHTLVLGPTGSGKSTLLGIIEAQAFRYPDATVIAFDKGMSMYALCEATGGQHFDVAGDSSKLAFAPLSHVKTKADISWFADWVEGICRLQNIELTPQRRKEIYNATVNCVETGSKTLSDFVNTVQDHDIRSAMEQYTIQGSMGHLLDAEQDGLSLHRFTVFEIEALMELSDTYGLPVLMYLFWRVEKMLKGQPTFLFLDEAWLMLKHPVFREKIREWLKVLRKANCVTVFSTQSIEDAQDSGMLSVLRDSCPTKIFLPNPEAMTEDGREIYRAMGLNNKEIQIVASATRKRQYYFVQSTGRRLIELALGEVALSFVGASGKKDIARIKELKAEFGSNWPQQWLIERRVNIQLELATEAA